MRLVNYMITSSALVTILIASTPVAQARIIIDCEDGSKSPKQTLRILGIMDQHGADEQSFNYANYGSYVKDHVLVKSAYFDPNQTLLKQATTDQELYGKLMSKVRRFPDLKQKIDALRN